MEQSGFNFKRVIIAAFIGLIMGFIIFSLTTTVKETPISVLLIKSLYIAGAFSVVALVISTIGFMVNTAAGPSSSSGGGSSTDSDSNTGYSDGGDFGGGGGD
jgi:uncharacterized membrane protein YgcG